MKRSESNEADNLSPAISVREARDRYLAENGFTIEGYSATEFVVDILGRKLKLKSPPARQRAVPFHDLHHVATGYGTDLLGEAEIGAWEVRAGLNMAFPYYILLAVAVGMVVAPRRVIRAFGRARGHRSLYRVRAIGYEQLLTMSVGELRALLGVPASGQADYPARLHKDAPRWAAAVV